MNILSINILLISDNTETYQVLQQYLRQLSYKNVKYITVDELSDEVFKKM
ncbi:MAG: hypothetical protein ACI9LM_004266 [Alteromonadaceae bacterium]|jgi:hypothetical protein